MNHRSNISPRPPVLFWITAAVFALLFAILTAVLCFVDVRPVGPADSSVGLATLNVAIRDLVGENAGWYALTECLGIAAIGVVLAFGILGLCQLIRRRSFAGVDPDILLLGALYVVIAGLYVIFEIWTVNCRPILMDGVLEASYPSSHTMLAVTVFGSTAMWIGKHMARPFLRITAVMLSATLAIVMLIGRLLSGVHWATDILAAALLAVALLTAYTAACRTVEGKHAKKLDSTL